MKACYIILLILSLVSFITAGTECVDNSVYYFSVALLCQKLGKKVTCNGLPVCVCWCK